MRNLVVLAERSHVLPAPSSSSASQWVDMSFDPAEERMWCLSSAGYLVGVVDGDVVVEVDLPSQPDWTWCAYHAELDIVVCASQSGALVSVHCPDQHVDVIGHFDFGIRGMRWSPNDEQVALVTGDGQFLTLSTTWNVMHESPCSSCAIDGLVQLSWRADGKFVSIQGPFSLHATLSLQVWAVDNAVWTLHAQGRHEDKSELALQGQGLHWSPNHALIASSEVFKNQLHVAFFETNGLRHGEMALSVDASASVTHLSWNLASDVLAVVTSTSSSGSSPSSTLQLWTRRNYYWYLKHTREYESPVSALQWDLEQPYVVRVLCSTGDCHVLSVMWKVASNAHGHVAVIDGRHVNVTLCDRALVPPPMSAARVQFAHAINDVLVLADGSIVAHDFRGNWSRSQQLHAPPQAIPLTYKDGRSVDTMALRYVQVVGTSTIAGISTLYPSQVVTMDVETGTLETTDYHEVVSTISNDGCHVQLSQSKAIWPQGVVQLSNGHCSTVVVQLAQTKLFVNNTLLHASVASFHVIPTLGYLALTTLGAKSEFRLYPLDALRQGTFVPEHTRPMERGATVVTSAHTTVVLQMERGNVEAIAPRPLLLALLQSQLVAHEFASALELCRKHRIDMNVLVDFDPTSFLSHLPQWIQAMPKRLRIDRLCLFITTVHPTDVCATKFPSLAGLNLLTETWDKVTRVCRAIRSTLVELDPDFYLLPLLTCDAKLLELDTALLRLQSLHGQNPTGAQHGLKHLAFLVDVDQLYDVALGLYDLPLTLLVAQHTQRDPKVYTCQLSAFQALEASHSSSYLRYAIDMSLHRYELALRHLYAAGPSYHSECIELVKSHHLYDIGLTLFPSASLLRTPIVSAYGRHLTAQAKYTQAGYTFLSIRAFEDAIEAFKRAQEWHMALALVPQVPSLNLASVAYALAEELVNRNELKDAARIYIEYCQDVDEGIATLLLGRYYADALHMALLHNRSDLVETDVHPAVEQAALDVEEEYEAKLESFQTHWTRLTTLRDQIRLFRLHGIDGKAADDDDDGAKDSASSAAASALSQSSSVSSVGSHNSNRDIKFGSLSVTSLAITSSYYDGRASNTSSSPSSTMKKKMPRRFRRCKIQQGSAEEDAYVLQSLVAAVPSADDLGHVRRVMQVLLYFGHVQQVTSIQRTIQRCLTHMAAHPLPPPVHGDAVPFDVPSVDESWLVLPMSM